MTQSSNPVDPRMTKARYNLIQNHPFWGQLAMYLEIIEDVDEAITNTMATDGHRMIYAPRHLDTLTPKQIEGEMAHEIKHCTNKHHLRRGKRDLKEWNVACDYEINPGLIDAGFHLPDGMLLDNAFRGMSAEEIYARRQKAKQDQGQQGQPSQPGAGQGSQPQGQGQGAGQGANQPQNSPASQASRSSQPGAGQGAGTTLAKGQGAGMAGQPGSAGGGQKPGVNRGAAQGAGQGSQPGAGCPWGQVLDAPVQDAADGASKAEQAMEWDRRVSQAIAVGRRAGNLPGDAEEMAERILEQKVDWREVLRRFIDAKTRTEHTWNRPNRRFISSGFLLPGTQSDGINKIGILADMSGSTAGKAGKFFGQVEEAMELGAVDSVVVVQFDTVVQRVDEYRAGDTIDPKVVGRGGTSFIEAFKWFEDQDCAAIIMFTDMECGEDWGDDPGVPVLWAAYGYESNIKRRAALAPFGETIHVED